MSEISPVERDLRTEERELPAWERSGQIALYGFSFVAVCAFLPAAFAKKKRVYSPMFPASVPAAATIVVEAAAPHAAQPPQMEVLERAPRCSDEDAAIIRDIFATSAQQDFFSLFLEKGRLEALGLGLKQRKVHPFEILRCAKPQDMRSILSSNLPGKASRAMEGIAEGMVRESANLERYAPGLAADMGKSAATLKRLIRAREWQRVVYYLYDIGDEHGE